MNLVAHAPGGVVSILPRRRAGAVSDRVSRMRMTILLATIFSVSASPLFGQLAPYNAEGVTTGNKAMRIARMNEIFCHHHTGVSR